MKVEILAVGTEVLMGDIVNTNAQYIARMLSRVGLGTYYHSAIGDNAERLKQVLEIGFKRADIIIATGGLGPTKDDLTKEVAAEFFNKKMILDETTLKNIEEYFHKLGRSLPDNNAKQAYFPESSHIIPNDYGTAPGCIIEENNKVLIMLPGPPRELKPMFRNYVLPYLKKYSNGILISDVIRMFGIGESHMEELIEDIIKNQSNPTIAPYAKDGEVTLRVTAWGTNQEEAISCMEPIKKELYNRLGKYIYGEGEKGLDILVCETLINKGITISVAESCTGGMVSSTFVDYPGISKVFTEGIVTYSNEAKMKYLGVKKETLELYGAVSHETAKEMAQGIRKTAKTAIGVATTGIAGPGGGSETKPVGLVYIGVAVGDNVYSYEIHTTGERQRIRAISTLWALYYVLQAIK